MDDRQINALKTSGAEKNLRYSRGSGTDEGSGQQRGEKNMNKPQVSVIMPVYNGEKIY